jgi:plastocyanin
MSRLCIAVLCAGLAACGAKAREPQTHQVAIRAMQFDPAELTVAVGDTVVWTNNDVVPHTVTSAPASPLKFDSQLMESKQQWRYTVTGAGELAYVCTFHPTMRAKLTVR